MSKFQVGDDVTCFVFGEGVIRNIRSDLKLPIVVEFKNCVHVYSLDGKLGEDFYLPTLYHKRVKIIECEPDIEGNEHLLGTTDSPTNN